MDPACVRYVSARPEVAVLEAAVALGATLQGIGGNSEDLALCKLLDVEDVPLSAVCVARSSFMLVGQQVYAKYSSDV